MPLQTDGRRRRRRIEGGSMLGKAYAQRPLDGTSETGPVLLRLLEDGLVGAVSITFATERAERKKKNKKKQAF